MALAAVGAQPCRTPWNPIDWATLKLTTLPRYYDTRGQFNRRPGKRCNQTTLNMDMDNDIGISTFMIHFCLLLSPFTAPNLLRDEPAAQRILQNQFSITSSRNMWMKLIQITVLKNSNLSCHQAQSPLNAMGIGEYNTIRIK